MRVSDVDRAERTSVEGSRQRVRGARRGAVVRVSDVDGAERTSVEGSRQCVRYARRTVDSWISGRLLGSSEQAVDQGFMEF